MSGQTKDDSINKMMGIPLNTNKEPIKVKHSELQPADPFNNNDSDTYKRACPCCGNGILLVGRNYDDYKLQESDHCISCGQRYIYIDIDDLNRSEGRLTKEDEIKIHRNEQLEKLDGRKDNV